MEVINIKCICSNLAQKPAPQFIGPEYDDSEEDEVVDFSTNQHKPG